MLGAAMPLEAEGAHSRGEEEICSRANVYLTATEGGNRIRGC